jgi:hypothetical protein
VDWEVVNGSISAISGSRVSSPRYTGMTTEIVCRLEFCCVIIVASDGIISAERILIK